MQGVPHRARRAEGGGVVSAGVGVVLGAMSEMLMRAGAVSPTDEVTAETMERGFTAFVEDIVRRVLDEERQ